MQDNHKKIRGGQKIVLEDFAEIVMGQSPSAKDVNREKDGLPLLNGPTEFGPDHPFPVQYTTNAKRVARKGDLLFCVRGSTTGRMNWADRDYAIGRGIAAIRHKTKVDLNRFVRGVIEANLESLLQSATGSTFPNVTADHLSSIQVNKNLDQVGINKILGDESVILFV